MKKVLTHRWFLGALCVLALSLLAWYLGELLPWFESRRARLLLVLLLVLGWLGYEGSRLWRERRANRALLERMAGAGGAEDTADQRSREEIALLKSRFEQAAGTLGKLRFEGEGGGRRLLYQMPWYMFIGAPGSGKTTALTRSGLRFPLADGGGAQAVQGVAGTRNCDWWFTDEAVFLDTAGRYTTQDSERKVDAAAWLGFLELLKKFRPGSPLNGAILTLSLSDLLSQNENQRGQYALAVRTRISELYEKLGTRFPIYLVVTKSDMMAGFSEYFADLGQEERNQVWGLTFPYQEAQAQGFDGAAAFQAGFAGLERRLYAGVADRMQAERDPQRRAAIFGFPQQLSLVGPLVQGFIAETFLASRYAQQPLLRGVYFTSGTQEGTPMDRVLGSVARALSLENRLVAPSAASGKSYFLTRLLREVVFPEAGLAGCNRAREQRQRWLLRGGFAALGLVSVLLLAGWAVSYGRNQELIAQAAGQLHVLQEQAAALPAAGAGSGDLAQVEKVLDLARDMPYAYAQRERAVPLLGGLGLFQGDTLGKQATVAYRRLLRDALLARIALRTEHQLRQPGQTELQYELLKVYLLLYDDKQRDGEQRAGSKAIENWVAADWGPKLPHVDGHDARQDLAGHVRAALERSPLELQVAKDGQLVESVRRQLAASALPERVYNRLKLLGMGSGLPGFRLSDALGAGGVQVLQRASGEPLSAPFPALYTREGYLKGFKAEAEAVASQLAAEERWVLGEMAGASAVPAPQLMLEVKRRYLEDYARAWDALLADLRLKPSNSLADTILYARVLGGPDSPLRKLVDAVSRETTLAADKSAADQAQDALQAAARKSMLDKAQHLAASLLGSTAQAMPAADPGQAPELRVEQRFEALRRLAGSAGQPAPIDALVAQLGDFHQELSALEGTLRGGVPLQGMASADKLKAAAAGLPAPLGGILRQLLANSSGQAAAAVTSAVAAGAQGASAFCDQAISGRYPFVKSAQAEVSPEDFGAVFGPGGDLDKYFQANLASQVDHSGPVWRTRPGGDGAAQIPPAILRQFQNADTVRKAFFRGGQAAATAELVLVASEAGSALIEYDGEQVRLAPGQGAVRLKWPAQRPAAQARLSLAAGGPGPLGEGNWALFRLFDKGQPESGPGSERLRLHYLVDGRKVVLELRATSVLNPFRLAAMDSFQCPGRRTKGGA